MFQLIYPKYLFTWTIVREALRGELARPHFIKSLYKFFINVGLNTEDTYDQSSDCIVHARHLYESHLSVFREELESFHGEAVLGESISNFLFSHSSTENTFIIITKHYSDVNFQKLVYTLAWSIMPFGASLTEYLINARSSLVDRCFDNSSSLVF